MSNLQSMHEKAAKYYEDKNLDKALEVYNEIIKINPVDETALSCVEDIYLEKDDEFNYYLARANVNISQNKIEYAINDTKKAIALELENVDARRKLARLYRVSNQNLKAIDEFMRLLEVKHDDKDAYLELIDVYMLENSLDSAITSARQASELFKDDNNISNILAQLYFKAGDYDKALEAVKDEMLRAKILLQADRNEEAKTIIEKYNPDNLNEIQKRNYFVLAAQMFYNYKDFDNSLSKIQEYVNIFGPDALSFQMKALIYEEKEDSFNSHLNWGFCYKFQDKIDDSVVEFSHAYHINNNDKTVLIELAKLYSILKEKYVSMEFWQKVYDIDKDEEAKEILAEFYYSEGDFRKAEEYGKVIEKKDEKPQEEYAGLIDKIMNFFSKKQN